MTNPYYVAAHVTAHTQGRAESINDQLDAIQAGFALLPDPSDLAAGNASYAVDTGAANAYVLTLANDIASYEDGLNVLFSPTHTNTTASSVNINAIGVIAIKRVDGTALQAGDLTAGTLVQIGYFGSTFRMIGLTAADVAAVATSATAAAASATAAASSASSASTSASSASTSATAAASSATAAASSATTATTQASAAATSATAAASAATAASTQATNSASSATTASTQATNAATSATAAASSATAAAASAVIAAGLVTRLAVISVTDPNGDAITTGDGKAYLPIAAAMNGMNLISAAAFVSTVSSSGLPTVQIRRERSGSPADMLSTKVSIDANEKGSNTAATAAVIDTGNDDVATGDLIWVDIDVSGTGAKGLSVVLGFQTP